MKLRDLLAIFVLLFPFYYLSGQITPLLSIASEAVDSKVSLFSKEEWMGIYSGENKIGYSHTLIKPAKENLEVSEESKLRMVIQDSNQDVEVKSNYSLDKYSLMSFNFSMKAGLVDLRAEGKREGKQLKIRVSSVSGVSDMFVSLADEPLVSSILFKWLSEQNPAVGKTYEVTLFDPTLILTGAESEGLKARLSVEGEEEIKIPLGSFETYRVKVLFMDSESTTWMTKEGEIIKEISPPGLISVRETKGKIFSDALTSLDIVRKTAISSNVLLDNARTLKLLRVKIDGIESTKGLDLEDGSSQFFKDGIIEVRKSDLSKLNPYLLPYSGKDYESYVKPGSLIQSDDPKIIRKSREILNGEENSIRAVKDINDWVYKNLDKVPTVSIPNALDVLKTKRGDCNEHATLFAALSRSVGIPTKMAFGIVYLDGKFYYHAWNEVFLGKWIEVDPTFGQFPADASHIKFVEGDLGRGSEMIKLVGKIKIEIRSAS
jgi:hypothetical protein